MSLSPSLGGRLADTPRRPKGMPHSQAELDEIAESHRLFLARRPGGRRALLSSARLFGLDLTRRELREADFSGADLSRATLRGGDFERASFYCADLRDARICYANLKGADLRGASLRGADLSFSIMDGADLRAAMMLRHDGNGGISHTVQPGDAPVAGGVDFSSCSMKGASLNGVNLKGANFRNALLHGVSFKGAKLLEANLENAVLTGVNVAELPFTGAELASCLLDPTAQSVSRAAALNERLKQHAQWVASGGKLGVAATIEGEDLRPLRSLLHGRELTALSAQRVVAVGVDFSRCQLQGADFSKADLRDCNFEGADLRGVNFRGAKLAHARFGKSDLRPLALQGGGIKPVVLDEAQYGPRQFLLAIL